MMDFSRVIGTPDVVRAWRGRRSGREVECMLEGGGVLRSVGLVRGDGFGEGVFL